MATQLPTVIPGLRVEGASPPANTPSAVPLCRVCKLVVDSDSVSCQTCLTIYHAGCVKRLAKNNTGGFKKCCGSRTNSPARDIPFSLAELVNAMKKAFDPRFDSIEIAVTANTAALERISGRVSTMEEDIVNLRTRMTTLEAAQPIAGHAATTDMSECLKEMEDRQSRKNNLIIQRAKESGSGDGATRLVHDSTLIRSLFEVLSLGGHLNNPLTGCSRCGKFSPNLARPRPIRLVLPPTLTPRAVIQCFTKRKKEANFPETLRNLVLTTDKTPMQLQEYRVLKKELIRRTAAGEVGLWIRTWNGAQKIVHSSEPPQDSTTPELDATPQII